MSRLHDKQINNNFSNGMPIGNSHNLNYNAMNMAHFTNTSPVYNPQNQPNDFNSKTPKIFQNALPVDKPQTKIPGLVSTDSKFNINNTINVISKQQEVIKTIVNDTQKAFNNIANFVLNTSTNQNEKNAALQQLNASQQQLNASKLQLSANDQQLYVNQQQVNKSLIDSAHLNSQMAANEATKAAINVQSTLAQNVNVKFTDPKINDAIKFATESAAQIAANVSNHVASSTNVLNSTKPPSVTAENTKNVVEQSVKTTTNTAYKIATALPSPVASNSMNNWGRRPSPVFNNPVPPPPTQSQSMQKLFGVDVNKNNPLSQLDNNYMKMKFDNNNNWNAIQIKGEQKVLSAFRNGGYQQESMADSQSCKIRSNFIPTNKDARRTKSALALLSHESS